MAHVHERIPDQWFHGPAPRAYEQGWYGVFGDAEDCPTWMRQVAQHDRNVFIERVGDDRYQVESVWPTVLTGTGAGKKSLNHLHIMRHIPEAFSGTQDYGNCRAWSMRFCTQSVVGMDIDAGDIHRADVKHGTALVYGSRQSSSQGMTMSRGCEVVTEIGQ